MKNLKSPLAWQVCGIIQKMNGHTIESAKSYVQALKYDTDNINILKDAANLYLHCRDYTNHQEMRRRIMINKPTVVSHWTSFAFACHINGNITTALEAMVSVFEIMDKDKNVSKLDKSNIFLYHVSLLLESSKYQEALDFLKDKKSLVVNKIEYKKLEIKLFMKLGQVESAYNEALELYKCHPENQEFLNLLMDCSSEGLSKYQRLKQIKTHMSNRLLNTLLLKETSDPVEFRSVFISEFNYSMTKFIPSFFKSIKCLLTDDSKVKVINEIVDGLLQEISEDPTDKLFILYFRAQLTYWHKNYKMAKQHIEDVISHTATFEDAYYLRSKIMIKLGQFGGLEKDVLNWVGLNIGDRCLNKQAIDVLLRANLNRTADELFKSFIKLDKGQEKSIYELQMMEYQIALATSYHQQLNFSRAIGILQNTCKVFQEIYDDQYDFYGYALRKNNFSELFEYISYNDKEVKQRKTYVKAHTKLLSSLISYQNYSACVQLSIENMKLDGDLKDQRANSQDIDLEDEKLTEELDLLGKNLLRPDKVNTMIANVVSKLKSAFDVNSTPKLKMKISQALYKYSINTNDFEGSFKYLTNIEMSKDSSIKRLVSNSQFKSKMPTFRKSANSDILSSMNEIATKISLREVGQSSTSASPIELFNSFVDYLDTLVSSDMALTSFRSSLENYISSTVFARYQELSQSQRRTIYKLAREYTLDRDLVLNLLAKSKEGHLTN